MNGGRGNCGWAVMYEKRLKVKKKRFMDFTKQSETLKFKRKPSLTHFRMTGTK